MNWPSRLPSSRRLRRAAISVALPAVALTTFVLPATTPAAYASSCPQFGLCTWDGAGFTGTQWNFTVNSGHPAGFWWFVGSAQNDKISSIINNHTANTAWFDKDCPAGGNIFGVPQLGEASNLAGFTWPDGTSADNSISAWGVGTSTPAHGNPANGGC